ncbi:MAG: hypothetical protein LBU83_13035 [Bacteroidales bacterium]|jgi:hypothetical protein|nr:hypothetical protein [Bacteroidales bacterium]
MKNIFLIFFAILFCVPIVAQKKEIEEPNYRRSSLHLVLVTTDDPILKETEVMKAWDKYPFPDKYNQHSVELKKFAAGKPGVSFFEFATQYVKGNSSLPTTIRELKKLQQFDTDEEAYIKAMIDRISNKIREEKLAHKLLEKWFNINPDGTYSMDLIQNRGCYNATEMQALEASYTLRGRAILEDAGEELIGNTFVAFCKIDVYENEPIAKFKFMIVNAIANLTEGGELIRTAGEIAYLAAKDGYSARTMAMLYKLNWNDSIKAEFYNCWKDDTHIDYEKFQMTPFNMVLVGNDISIGKAIAPFGINFDEKKLIDLTIVRNIDNLFAKLQAKYEVFKPKFLVLTNPPLTAEMGMKEGLSGGEKFELLEQIWNTKKNKREYKRVAIVKVDKKQIWDNRYFAGEENPKQQIDKKTGEPIKSTLLTKFKGAYPGMLLRQIK